jgi:hypothetical protein
MKGAVSLVNTSSRTYQRSETRGKGMICHIQNSPKENTPNEFRFQLENKSMTSPDNVDIGLNSLTVIKYNTKPKRKKEEMLQ